MILRTIIIYQDIPPVLKSETSAQLINTTSIITLNENYLLAACLGNSLLARIKINDGDYTSLLSYSDISIYPNLGIPITICSLSSMDNFVFIGYSRIDYNQIQTNKTNFIIKLKISYDYSGNPILDSSVKQFYQFPSSIKTPSSRQISCEPLRYKNDNNNFRLVCLYEDLQFDENYQSLRFYLFGAIINQNFD